MSLLHATTTTVQPPSDLCQTLFLYPDRTQRSSVLLIHSFDSDHLVAVRRENEYQLADDEAWPEEVAHLFDVEKKEKVKKGTKAGN